MCQMTGAGYQGRGSPDRVDALVWAIHDLMIGPAQSWRNPPDQGVVTVAALQAARARRAGVFFGNKKPGPEQRAPAFSFDFSFP